MRLFFGLKPDPQTCLDIERWRQRTLPPLDRPVPSHNLHMTLVFLGEVKERQLERLTEEVQRLRAAPFAMVFDELGYFPKPQILWIGPKEAPDAAGRLARDLNRICRRLGLRSEKRKFQAHLTIARRCATPPPASAVPPNFRMEFDSFVLFESTNTRSGVLYRAVDEWPLE